MDSSALTLWTGTFLTERFSGLTLLLLCLIEIPVFHANSETLIRRRDLRRLVMIYTFCQCLYYGTLGIDGLNVKCMCVQSPSIKYECYYRTVAK